MFDSVIICHNAHSDIALRVCLKIPKMHVLVFHFTRARICSFLDIVQSIEDIVFHVTKDFMMVTFLEVFFGITFDR